MSAGPTLKDEHRRALTTKVDDDRTGVVEAYRRKGGDFNMATSGDFLMAADKRQDRATATATSAHKTGYAGRFFHGCRGSMAHSYERETRR